MMNGVEQDGNSLKVRSDLHSDLSPYDDSSWGHMRLSSRNWLDLN